MILCLRIVSATQAHIDVVTCACWLRPHITSAISLQCAISDEQKARVHRP